jgi:hypothetical protein
LLWAERLFTLPYFPLWSRKSIDRGDCRRFSRETFLACIEIGTESMHCPVDREQESRSRFRRAAIDERWLVVADAESPDEPAGGSEEEEIDDEDFDDDFDDDFEEELDEEFEQDIDEFDDDSAVDNDIDPDVEEEFDDDF